MSHPTFHEARDNAICSPTWFSGTHNTDGDIAMSKFPHVRIGDDVRAQEQLLREVFSIEPLVLAEVDAHVGELLNTLV